MKAMSHTSTPPSTIITPDNHGGLITITAAVGMTFALSSMGIRIYARTQINGPWSHDDSALLASAFFCIFQSIAKMIAVANGLGKTIELIDPVKLLAVQKSDYAADLLYIITIFLSKASAVFLYLRLTPNKAHKIFCWSIMATSTLWVILSLFIVALRCQLSQPWVVNQHCVNVFLRWQIVGALDGVTELALFAMAIYLVLGLRMNLQLKAFVVSAFAFRLPAIAFIILRLYYLKIELASSDPTFNAVLTSIWTQVHEDYIIIATTIPCLKPFMVACNTGWGHAAPHTGNGSKMPHSGSYGLVSLTNGAKSNAAGKNSTLVSSVGIPNMQNTTTTTTTTNSVGGGGARPDLHHLGHHHHHHNNNNNNNNNKNKNKNKSGAVVGGNHSRQSSEQAPVDEAAMSIASNDSQQMIIRREVGYSVTYDDEVVVAAPPLPFQQQQQQPQQQQGPGGRLGAASSNHRADIEAQNPMPMMMPTHAH